MDVLTFSLVYDWTTTLTLIFGGCCSNALTLEQLTSQYPRSGSLITFAQFLMISLHGLPKFIVFTPYPRLRPRQIPITPYLVQVALFYAVSLLNNTAFAYRIPMAVHIIFRSGGLVINMIMGWLLRGKRYNLAQVLSVLLVTGGVILTTLSASKSDAGLSTSSLTLDHTKTYAFGIGLLTLALVLSGFLGMVQDFTFAKYVHGKAAVAQPKDKDAPAPWQESMFYLHLLSMPMFLSVREDLSTQLAALQASPTMHVVIPASPSALLQNASSFATSKAPRLATLALPSAYVPLVLNTLTQLVCVAGVHRLTARVSSLTVTLVLVVRKAVSLLISILFGRGAAGMEHKTMMWTGAACVFVGTILYSLASRTAPVKAVEKAKSD